jgi:hypothetical protein
MSGILDDRIMEAMELETEADTAAEESEASKLLDKLWPINYYFFCHE